MGQVRATLRERVGSFRCVGHWDMGHLGTPSVRTGSGSNWGCPTCHVQSQPKSFLKSRVLACHSALTVMLSVVSLSHTLVGQAWDKLGQYEYSVCCGTAGQMGLSNIKHNNYLSQNCPISVPSWDTLFHNYGRKERDIVRAKRTVRVKVLNNQFIQSLYSVVPLVELKLRRHSTFAQSRR
jgi:hypothetical protein